MITDPWFYSAAIPAILLTGISKGGFAGGIGLVAVPLIALTISPVQAAGIMLPILIIMDMIGVWAYRRSFDRLNLLYLLPVLPSGSALERCWPERSRTIMSDCWWGSSPSPSSPTICSAMSATVRPPARAR